VDKNLEQKETNMKTEKFTASNTAMLLIDHQVGTLGWCQNIPQELIRNNTRALARAAKALGMPLILTSSMEDQAQGPLIKDLEEIAPEEHARRVKRVGVVNAFDDPNYKAAVMATGRKNLIMAGLTNDVCVVYPAMSAVEEGFNVQVVVDAGGSPTQISDETALRRMERAGVTLTSTTQLIAGLAGSWTSESGSKLIQVLFEEILVHLGKTSS
jgi:nicotinamidase-related amidase